MNGWGLLVILAVLTSAARPAIAQTPPATDDPKVALSGYIQPQLEIRAAGGATRDQALLRRAVVTLDITLTNNWQAEFQTDFGPLTDDSDRITVKNALIKYAGWEDTHGIVLTIGNQKIPFSRSTLGSSSRRGLVERPFTGDRGYGSPGRAISLRADGWHRNKTFFWSASVADTRHSGDPDELRIDGAAELGDDGMEGHLLGGRVEFHPLGEVPREHGDFMHGPLRVTVGAGAYAWRSDGDSEVTAHIVDVSRVSGLEISGALRGAGLSVDAEFEHVSADARRPLPADGLYALGNTDVRKASIEVGYMLVSERFELLTAADTLDTRTFDRPWRRVAVGANWYVKRHALKFSFMHRESLKDEGAAEGRSRATYLQAHVGF
jgi:phosphate-selective porin OprO and OprP